MFYHLSLQRILVSFEQKIAEAIPAVDLISHFQFISHEIINIQIYLFITHICYSDF